ncbi:MAG: esterase [Betaproteobacteria bacterium]|nr:esterase [Betaproteobacteria bacterium]
MAAFFAGQGYAVVASDYLGYAKSAYSYHPYLHSDTEASATIDAIRAARQVAREKGQALSGKLMLYGYSQGGHSSMSTHKAIETDPALSAEMGLVAAAHGAAPSALSTALQAAEPVLYGQIFITFAVTAWQKVYGNVYAKPSDAFKAPYADGIESILPSATTNFDGLLAQNKVSQDLGSGWLNAMFTDSFLNDLKNNANSGVIQAAKKNDLVASSWTPKSPTLLCAGSGDPVVPYKSAQALAAAKWKGLSNVTVVDVDAQAQGFAQQLWAGQTASQKAGFGNSIDVYTRFNYHGTLAPPLCLSAVKSVFDKLK